MKIINTPRMPIPKGHYSNCVKHKGLLYLSGQLPVEDMTGHIPEAIGEQTELVLRKIEHILGETGSNRQDIIHARIYLTNSMHWDEVNERYAAFMGKHRPARCIVTVKELHFGCGIEAEVIARVKKLPKI